MTRTRLSVFLAVTLLILGTLYLAPSSTLISLFPDSSGADRRRPVPLAERLAQHAGIYADKSRIEEDRGAEGVRAETLRKTVLFSTANWGFVDLA